MELVRVKCASLSTMVLGNAGRSGSFILRSRGELGQPVQIGLFGRGVTQTRMRSARVVPVKVFGNVGTGCFRARAEDVASATRALNAGLWVRWVCRADFLTQNAFSPDCFQPSIMSGVSTYSAVQVCGATFSKLLWRQVCCHPI